MFNSSQRILEVGGLVNRQGVKNAGFDTDCLSVCPLTFPGCFCIPFSSLSLHPFLLQILALLVHSCSSDQN